MVSTQISMTVSTVMAAPSLSKMPLAVWHMISRVGTHNASCPTEKRDGELHIEMRWPSFLRGPMCGGTSGGAAERGKKNQWSPGDDRPFLLNERNQGVPRENSAPPRNRAQILVFASLAAFCAHTSKMAKTEI